MTLRCHVVILYNKTVYLLRWMTPVHETRYEAERCIEQAKTDIAILERQLIMFGLTRDMLNEKEKRRRQRKKKSIKSSEDGGMRQQRQPMEQDEPKIVTEKKVNMEGCF